MLNRDKPYILGMIQPEPMPGSYRHRGESFEEVYALAFKEVEMLGELGFDGYIVQNRNDAPVRQEANTETIAQYSILCYRLKQAFPDLMQGVLINWDGIASVAVADVAQADFVRIEHCYTGVEVGYAGLLEAQCVDVCNFRKRIGSKVPVWADVQEVHYEQIGGKDLVSAAFDTVYNAFADGLFLGGRSAEESIEIVQKVRKRLACDLTIMLSGGSTGDNVRELMKYYDGVSVGSWIKDGNMKNPINYEKAKYFIEQAKR